jgi:hypothetical protein
VSVVKMTAAAVVASPKMQARKIREEAKVVRSINFPVPISVLSPVREAKLCPTDRAFVCSNCRSRAWISAAVDNQAATPAKMLFTNNFQAACPEREQVRESG